MGYLPRDVGGQDRSGGRRSGIESWPLKIWKMQIDGTKS